MIMPVNIFIVILLVLFAKLTLGNSDEEYVDSVINMLLNGESFESQDFEETGQDPELVLIGGVWKCGNCADIGDSKLVYSEVTDLDADVTEDQPVEVQISLAIPEMACVSVVGEQPGVVQRVSGACSGDRVTLSVAAARHFTINVYTR